MEWIKLQLDEDGLSERSAAQDNPSSCSLTPRAPQSTQDTQKRTGTATILPRAAAAAVPARLGSLSAVAPGHGLTVPPGSRGGRGPVPSRPSARVAVAAATARLGLPIRRLLRGRGTIPAAAAAAIGGLWGRGAVGLRGAVAGLGWGGTVTAVLGRGGAVLSLLGWGVAVAAVLRRGRTCLYVCVSRSGFNVKK